MKVGVARLVKGSEIRITVKGQKCHPRPGPFLGPRCFGPPRPGLTPGEGVSGRWVGVLCNRRGWEWEGKWRKE